jgi:hypothetical protein
LYFFPDLHQQASFRPSLGRSVEDKPDGGWREPLGEAAFQHRDVLLSRSHLLLPLIEVGPEVDEHAVAPIQIVLTFFELLGLRLQLALPRFEAVGERFHILADDRGQLVVKQDRQTMTHRNSDRIAVPLPHRPHRRRRRHLDQPLPLLLVEIGAESVVDLAQDLTAQRHALEGGVSAHSCIIGDAVYWFTATEVVATV